MPRRLLVLGSSWFLGRAVTDAALTAGWDVTTFRRGRVESGADPAGVTTVRGDYADPAAVAALAEAGPFDAVVDNLAYTPRETLAVARALEPVVERYVLVSTLSAYAGWPIEPLTEDSATLDCAPDAGPNPGHNGDPGPSTYGFGKAGCERAVTSTFGADRVAVLRAGVILGPHDYVGRLSWWLRRVRRGGRVLAPGDPLRGIQPIDVRDVAAFALRCAAGTPGVFNVTGPGTETFGDLLDACARVVEPPTGTELVWASDEFLVSQGLRQWTELPLWRAYPGTWAVDASRARAAGLVTRSLAETVRDTWEWLTGDAPVGHERAGELGIMPEREAEVLAAWTDRQSGR
ncbi:NAD-dependent epimerase [Solihabitans fulvus]|uniref:NAD-dependent epimerase n=1 Tax=Solihabitans fulvus TaxID=1892852 RepID=A0A5B2XFQ8_9PSEU|nr:NAD-dependent epimerase/dehydratase family protein [Solihabitans fulvus]KAA2261954.1 NAD-dependent epimerase [Solihabitans fulvus]